MYIKTIMIRPSGNGCNLACSYCYVSSKTSNINFLLLDDLKKLFYLVKKENPNYFLDIFFHGGEPLLWGINNYEKTFSWIKKKIPNYKLKIQTNGTLLNDNYLKLFKKYNVYISLSLDGPKPINDLIRTYKDKSSSYDVILKSIQKLKKQQNRVGAVSVVTKNHLGKEKELYDFYKSKQLGFQPSPLVNYGRAKDMPQLMISSKEYVEFMKNLFDIWFEDDYPLDIPYFLNIISAFINNKTISMCKFSKGCVNTKKYICLNSNGDISICNRSSEVKDEFVFGNINHLKSLNEIYNSKKYKNLQNRTNLLKKQCVKCNLYKLKLCVGAGGCPFMSHLQGNINELPKSCSTDEEITLYIYNKIKEYIPALKKRCE